MRARSFSDKAAAGPEKSNRPRAPIYHGCKRYLATISPAFSTCASLFTFIACAPPELFASVRVSSSNTSDLFHFGRHARVRDKTKFTRGGMARVHFNARIAGVRPHAALS